MELPGKNVVHSPLVSITSSEGLYCDVLGLLRKCGWLI